jgi:hypothetical protein
MSEIDLEDAIAKRERYRLSLSEEKRWIVDQIRAENKATLNAVGEIAKQLQKEIDAARIEQQLQNEQLAEAVKTVHEGATNLIASSHEKMTHTLGLLIDHLEGK